LNGILGFSELLYREYRTIDPNEIQEIAESIHTSALRLHRLMQNFLLYTNLELLAHNPDQLQLLQNKTTKAPGLVIQQIAEHLARQANRYPDLQFNFVSEVDAESVVVRLPESYLSKIVEELVDNALKFSEPGTPIIVQSQLQNQQFWLSVSNQGRGMTPGQIASLGAYMQFDRKSYEQQGTGLGLSLVKQIASLCNGSFQIHSVPGESTVIQIGFGYTEGQEMGRC
jgi:signal transduction histidine kinase